MKLLPPASEMWRAVVARDASYDGTFVLAVRTTGIYCRPSCPARKPKRENVRWFEDPSAAELAGFRACKRCRPHAPLGGEPDFVQRAVELSRSREARVTDKELDAAGLSPSRLRRFFLERHGMTFQAWQRAERLGRARRDLANGQPTSGVALQHGFESESGFRDAFRRLFGETPGRAAGRSSLFCSVLTSPLGPLFACAGDEGLAFLEFHDRRAIGAQATALTRRFGAPVVPGTHRYLEQLAHELDEYFAGRRERFDVPLAVRGTPFQESVWAALGEIPYGQTRSYDDIARAVGRPAASRAVGRANGLNRLAIVVPCHRVVRKDGSLCGYGGGLWRKRALLELERERCLTAESPAPSRPRG